MPGTILDTVFRSGRNTVQELIGRTAEELMPTMDPITRDPVWNSITTDNIMDVVGRDLMIRHQYDGSLAGVIQPAQRTNFFTMVGDKMDGNVDLTGRLRTLNPTQAWPSFKDGAVAQSWGLTWTLGGFLTNIGWSLSMLTMEATPANIRKYVAPIMQGFGRNITRYVINGFYANPLKGYALGTLASGATTAAGTRTLTFQPAEETVVRFEEGMAVDIVNSTQTARINANAGIRIRAFVVSRNPFKNTVTIAFDNKDVQGNAVDFATWILANGGLTTANNIVRYADVGIDASGNLLSGGTGIKHMYTWRDWFKFGGSTPVEKRLLGDQAVTATANDFIDVDVREQFQSLPFNVNGSLTEKTLVRQLSLAQTGMRSNGYDVTQLIFAPGIMQNIFEGRLNREYEERKNMPGSTDNLGYKGGFSISTEYGKVSGETSHMLDAGHILGVNNKKNWTLVSYALPRGAKKSSQEGKDPKIPLILPFGAFNGGDVMQYMDPTTNMPTEFAFTPGYVTMQFGPGRQIPGVVWSNVTDSRIFR